MKYVSEQINESKKIVINEFFEFLNLFDSSIFVFSFAKKTESYF